MKRHYILFFLLFSSCLLTAQSAKEAPPKVGKTAEALSFSSTLAEGKLIFTKVFKRDNSNAFVPSYTLQNPSHNNGQPVEIKLNKENFDTYFKTTQELSSKWTLVAKFAQEKNLSYSEEKGWVTLIGYYNGLQ
jgi:hypothetical protein